MICIIIWACQKAFVTFLFFCYLYEGGIPEAGVKRDDCITVKAPQGALYPHTFCPSVTGLSTKKGAQGYPLLVAKEHEIWKHKIKTQNKRTELGSVVLPVF